MWAQTLHGTDVYKRQDHVTECDNRVWGCSSKENVIYAPKLAAGGTETAVASRKALDKTLSLIHISAPGNPGQKNSRPRCTLLLSRHRSRSCLLYTSLQAGGMHPGT